MNTLTSFSTKSAQDKAMQLANLATQALIDEARLSPKPGLVDRRSSGAHTDLTLNLMEKSAYSLADAFYEMALRGWCSPINVVLRREIGRIGRDGEKQMMAVTGGVNTHRGAIWSLGLLVTVLASVDEVVSAEKIAKLVGDLANLPDVNAPKVFSKGLYASKKYCVPGAREEAQQGFPHIIKFGLPTLRESRKAGANESQAQINALLAIMSSLTDTCVLSRAGMSALKYVQQTSKAILAVGGVATEKGQALFDSLDKQMLVSNISPGGAADLLAATLLLDRTSVIQ